MGLLPMDLDILPPSDDRVFKLILTSPEAKPGLVKLIAGVIGRNVLDVVVHNNELPPGDTEEKAERFDVNCKIDDGSQINLEMQASRIQEDSDGQYQNLKGKSIYYLCDLHSSQPSRGIRRYDRLSRTYQVTFCSYTVFPHRADYVNSFSLRHCAMNCPISVWFILVLYARQNGHSFLNTAIRLPLIRVFLMPLSYAIYRLFATNRRLSGDSTYGLGVEKAFGNILH